jgi:CheY-like chemotaxis protein
MEVASLQGRSVLIVEDEYLIAIDMRMSMADAGACVIGPVGSAHDALELLSSETRIDAAVLDVHLGREDSWIVADALTDRGIPFVFATADNARSLPARHANVPICEKPLELRFVTGALASRVRKAEEEQTT